MTNECPAFSFSDRVIAPKTSSTLHTHRHTRGTILETKYRLTLNIDRKREPGKTNHYEEIRSYQQTEQENLKEMKIR